MTRGRPPQLPRGPCRAGMGSGGKHEHGLECTSPGNGTKQRRFGIGNGGAFSQRLMWGNGNKVAAVSPAGYDGPILDSILTTHTHTHKPHFQKNTVKRKRRGMLEGGGGGRPSVHETEGGHGELKRRIALRGVRQHHDELHLGVPRAGGHHALVHHHCGGGDGGRTAGNTVAERALPNTHDARARGETPLVCRGAGFTPGVP